MLDATGEVRIGRRIFAHDDELLPTNPERVNGHHR
jgi:hypothetical protein